MFERTRLWAFVVFVVIAGVGLSQPLAAQCVPSTNALCLNGNKFQVTANWRTPDGLSGAGHAVPLTADTGYFWFFNPANIEMMVKVIDGCALNQRYWVFAGGLTNIEVTLVVESHLPGQRTGRKTFVNPQNKPFQPIQSTDAFSCGRGVRGSPD